MGSRRKSARQEALELTRELETSEGVQAQLYEDAQKSRIEEMKTELEELVASNQDVEDLNARLVRKIEMIKANYGRIVMGLEKFRQLQLSRQS